MRRVRTPLVFLLVLVTASTPALAGGNEPPHRPRFEAWGGVFFTGTDTRFQVDSETLGDGTPIDGEEDLGLPRDGQALRVGAAVRFGARRRHVVEASYFTLDREADTTVTSQIRFGEETVTAETPVSSRFAADIARFHYTFMVLSGARHEAGITVGLQASDVDVALTAPDLGIDEAAGAPVPLPTIGLRSQVHVTPRIKLRSATDVFTYSGDQVSGLVWDTMVGIDLDVTRNTGVGLGYNFVRVDADVDLPDFSGFLDLTYGGVLATFRVMM
ncbi:MAG: hypothetical protein ACFB6R_09155 [Alphaproteobacteria bacterium]